MLSILMHIRIDLHQVVSGQISLDVCFFQQHREASASSLPRPGVMRSPVLPGTLFLFLPGVTASFFVQILTADTAQPLAVLFAYRAYGQLEQQVFAQDWREIDIALDRYDKIILNCRVGINRNKVPQSELA